MTINHSIQDAANRYHAAVFASGQAVTAVQSGLGVANIGIEGAEVGDDYPYRAVCVPCRFRGVASKLRFLIAGEAAQVMCGLSSFHEINLLTEHSAAAALIRHWDKYWGWCSGTNLTSYSSAEEEEEVKSLIWLIRWQAFRRLRCEPERSAVEALALEIRDGKVFSGAEAERFVRGNCRSRNQKSSSLIPISES